MKIQSAILIAFFLISSITVAQKDTVYIDVNDSTLLFSNLPSGYMVIDTSDKVANQSTLITGTVGLSNSPNQAWNGLVLNYPDSLQNKFVHWSFRNSNGNSTGIAKFRKDGILLDSLILVNDSNPVFYADTFATGNFDTLQYKVSGVGPDTIEFRIGAFQIRTEIRISLLTSSKELSTTSLNISAYPNPSNNYIFFKEFKLIQNKVFQLFDLRGKLIKEGVLRDNKLEISKLASGQYLFIVPEEGISIKFQKK